MTLQNRLSLPNFSNDRLLGAQLLPLVPAVLALARLVLSSLLVVTVLVLLLVSPAATATATLITSATTEGKTSDSYGRWVRMGVGRGHDKSRQPVVIAEVIWFQSQLAAWPQTPHVMSSPLGSNAEAAPLEPDLLDAGRRLSVLLETFSELLYSGLKGTTF